MKRERGGYLKKEGERRRNMKSERDEEILRLREAKKYEE